MSDNSNEDIKADKAQQSEGAPWERDPCLIPQGSEVPDLGKADTPLELSDWCNTHRELLRQLRIRLGLSAPVVSLAELCAADSVVRHCRRYLNAVGAGDLPERYRSFPPLPYHGPATRTIEAIEEMEDFLAWAAGRCRQLVTQTEEAGATTSAVPAPVLTPNKVPAAQTEGAEGGRDQGGARPPEGKKAKRRRGRIPDTDPKEDERIADAWRSGAYKTYEECGKALRISEKQVGEAIDRHRHRPAGKRSKRRKPPE